MQFISEIINTIHLSESPCPNFEMAGQGGFVEIVSYLNGGDRNGEDRNGEDRSCPAVMPLAIFLNNYLADHERSALVTFIGRAVGSETSSKEEKKRRIALLPSLVRALSIVADNYGIPVRTVDRYVDYDVYDADNYSDVRYAGQYAAAAAEFAADVTDSAQAREKIIDLVFNFLDAALPPEAAARPILIERAKKLIAR